MLKTVFVAPHTDTLMAQSVSHGLGFDKLVTQSACHANHPHEHPCAKHLTMLPNGFPGTAPFSVCTSEQMPDCVWLCRVLVENKINRFQRAGLGPVVTQA